MHCLSVKVFSLDETIHLISEVVLGIPDVLFLDHVQIERTDLLYAEEGLPHELSPELSHHDVGSWLVSFFVHEVAHPFVFGSHVRFPLEFGELC